MQTGRGFACFSRMPALSFGAHIICELRSLCRNPADIGGLRVQISPQSAMAEGKKIVKCVPNFATNDDKVRERIITAIREVSGCEVLDATSNQTNRTFCTFIGPPKGVLDAALAAAEVAHECIDMSAHAGRS